MDLKNYLQKFTHLGIDKSKRKTMGGDAPHKPLLLLSIIELINKGQIQQNQITLSPELIATFKENWLLLVTTKHTCQLIYPFFYLKNDGFWQLIPKPDCTQELQTVVRFSFNSLNAIVAYAELESDLFQLLLNPNSRYELQHCLLTQYFPETMALYLNKAQNKNNYLEQLETKMIQESATEYRIASEALKDEEEIFLRSQTFKKLIPRLYNDTCCISGWRLDNLWNLQMIDACHIIPFSISHDDTVSNGIALCPNLHRAFDRGLLTIDNDFKVKISPYLAENTNTNYGIKQFANQAILLPSDALFYPRLDNLKWHQENVFRA
ncbi:putative restriction endonuclease [Beggiatoa alba B18LD]|uniref:Putative restriction endonuclease n=1 Tax=Beggiatoa alba B18LD TaxID=395493 RepID=I3CK82_9GAMM|nr:HNH endonuclease [Beggiatoa alba]EIJ44025.1 putative restriction endonuclease [Beggiatoa alba B18LD]